VICKDSRRESLFLVECECKYSVTIPMPRGSQTDAYMCQIRGRHMNNIFQKRSLVNRRHIKSVRGTMLASSVGISIHKRKVTY